MRSRAGTCASVLWNVACRSMLPVASKASAEEARRIQRLLACKPGRCVYCNGPASSVDHFRPIMDARGYPTGYGSDPWNLVPACMTCNSSKGNKHWLQFMQSKTPSSPLTRRVKNWTGRVQALKRFDAAGQTRTRRISFAVHNRRVLENVRRAVGKYAEMCWSEVSKCLCPLPPVGTVFVGRAALQRAGVHVSLRSWFVLHADGSLASLCLGQQAIVADDAHPYIGIACKSKRLRDAMDMAARTGQTILVTRSWRLRSARAPRAQKAYAFAGKYRLLKPSLLKRLGAGAEVQPLKPFRFVLMCEA